MASQQFCWHVPDYKGKCRENYRENAGAPRVLALEKSLKASRHPKIKDLMFPLEQMADERAISVKTKRLILDDAIRTVMPAKNISPLSHPTFSKIFEECVELSLGYRQLCAECESLRCTLYDYTNDDHEELLLRLWDLLMPHEPLQARVTKQWQEIGSQGNDPKTDFRGMGILGLENLVYFAREYPSAARYVLANSIKPRGYDFAIVGINITSMAPTLLKDGSAKTHVYNTRETLPGIRAFHLLYCYLFYEFDKFWIKSKPKNMMDFPVIRSKFEKNIRNSLQNPATVFTINFSRNNV